MNNKKHQQRKQEIIASVLRQRTKCKINNSNTNKILGGRSYSFIWILVCPCHPRLPTSMNSSLFEGAKSVLGAVSHTYNPHKVDPGVILFSGCRNWGAEGLSNLREGSWLLRRRGWEWSLPFWFQSLSIVLLLKSRNSSSPIVQWALREFADLVPITLLLHAQDWRLRCYEQRSQDVVQRSSDCYTLSSGLLRARGAGLRTHPIFGSSLRQLHRGGNRGSRRSIAVKLLTTEHMLLTAALHRSSGTSPCHVLLFLVLIELDFLWLL